MVKAELPWEEANSLAMWLRDRLSASPLFTRVEIAGSVRRKKPIVGDIEIVAQGNPNEEFMREARTRELLDAGCLVYRAPLNAAGHKAPWGPRYYKGVRGSSTGAVFQLDLFVVLPPAEWGPVFLIRTGSAQFSQAMVTRLHRYNLQSVHGHIEDFDHRPVQCPDEETFFRLARIPVLPPENRALEDPACDAAFKSEMPK